jgi:hypothetical protein
MSATTFAEICAARDEQLAGISVALARIQREIQLFSGGDLALLQRLFDRQRNLILESDDVARSATDQILALPEVIAAGKTLVGLGKSMARVAAQMPTIKKGYLAKSAEVLTVAKKFVDVIAEAKKPAPAVAPAPAVGGGG